MKKLQLKIQAQLCKEQQLHLCGVCHLKKNHIVVPW